MFIQRIFTAGIAFALLTGCSKKAEEVAPAQTDLKAPDVFRVNFDTSKGGFVVEVNRAWSPRGADRFYTMVKANFFDGARFFRVLPGFMVQFGLAANPAENAKWPAIDDDPVTQSNKPGYVSFATAGPSTRTTQVFINYGDNARLDATGFSPFGKVVSGMDVVEHFYGDYGEGAPSGGGPEQGQLKAEGNKYLEANFPKLDYIKTARLAPGN
jgi:peptidyl-prolyl cis-trans isomerase A (cyclophilin A)